MTEPAGRQRLRDEIIPGSVRVEVVQHVEQRMTIRCGRCGFEFDVMTWNHTTRCRLCGRVCRFRYVPLRGVGNVVPFRSPPRPN